MSSYEGITRTNYFSVTDPEKLRDIVSRIWWEDSGKLDIFKDENVDGFFAEQDGKYAFGAFDYTAGLIPDSLANKSIQEIEDAIDEWDAGDVFTLLQEIVSPGDVIIITEIGNESLRRFVGTSALISHDAIHVVDLEESTLIEAADMLGNSNFETIMEG